MAVSPFFEFFGAKGQQVCIYVNVNFKAFKAKHGKKYMTEKEESGVHSKWGDTSC